MLLAFMCLLEPSRLQSPSSYPVETIAAPFLSGAERNRTAVRATGVDHLVRNSTNNYIFAVVVFFGQWVNTRNLKRAISNLHLK